jgi:molybdopterin converting factor small subunit
MLRPAHEDEVHIRVRTFATLRDALGRDEIILHMKGPQTVDDVLLHMERVFGEPVKIQLRDAITEEYIPFLVMLNDHTVPISRRRELHVKDGDRVTILPPIDGG